MSFSVIVPRMVKKARCMFILLTVMLFVLWPLGKGAAQDANDPSGNTLGQGMKIIRDAKDNKLVTPEQRAAESVGEESPSQEQKQEQSAPPDEGRASPGAPEPARGDALISGDEKPPYDSTGMRDPFKPFIKLTDTPTAPSVALRPPIQRYPLNQFRITGIVWIGGKPQAMVVDPEGNTYFLGVGDKIGSSDGEILEVRQNGILVQERTRFENVYGEVKIEVKQSVLAFQNE
ncbi:MAG TPA: pilus assembly protein PilP [Thermodesulfobacteriota bacterium]|nr:pilus assembly protein PilP [Thermodesulfobacteriota bacterium]